MKKIFRSFLFGTKLPHDRLLNFGWLLFRVHIGLSMAIHAGWPKITGASAPDWFIKQVGEIGFTFPSAEFWAIAATWGEFIGGLMIAIGFLTRFAALQLAFQFFVISFIWYNEPEPLTGMYFQQLLMWCYLLIVVTGGGWYSVDRLINRKQRDKMPANPGYIALAKTLPVIFFMFLVVTILPFFKPSKPRVSMQELKPYLGKWSGNLAYTDYETKKWVNIPLP